MGPPNGTGEPPDTTPPWVPWHALLILAATGAVYANSFGNAFVWDDQHLIVANPAIKGWGRVWGLWTADLFPSLGSHYYRPLQALTYLLDYQLWRLNPFGYHLTNTLLHAGVSLLFYRFVALLVGTPRAACIAALLFTVHPIHTEAVTYISGRADSLAAFFLLGALLCFGADRRQGGRVTVWRLGSLVCCALALLARETAVVLLPLLVLVDLTLRRRAGRPRRGAWGGVAARYLPYAGVFALYAGARVVAVGTAGIATPLADIPLPLRLATMLEVVVRYVALLVVPVSQHMERQVTPATSLYDPAVLGAALLVGGLAGTAIVCRRRAWPLSFGIAWFMIALLPVSNLVPLATFMAEHWLYVPSLGLFLAAGWGLERALAGTRRAAITAVIGLALIAYGGLTIRRNHDWRDELAIYQATLRQAPHSILVRLNLGDVYHRRGQLERAAATFREALALDLPGNDLSYAGVHNNLGLVLRDLGRTEEGKEEFRAALRRDPANTDAYGNLGNYYSRRGQLTEAMEAYQTALRLDPDSARARNNLATLYVQTGQLALAERELRRAVALDPDLEQARRNLAVVVKARRATPGPPAIPLAPLTRTAP